MGSTQITVKYSMWDFYFNAKVTTISNRPNSLCIFGEYFFSFVFYRYVQNISFNKLFKKNRICATFELTDLKQTDGRAIELTSVALCSGVYILLPFYFVFFFFSHAKSEEHLCISLYINLIFFVLFFVWRRRHANNKHTQIKCIFKLIYILLIRFFFSNKNF